MRTNVPNLDAMPSQELFAFAMHHDMGEHHVELFPDGGGEAQRAASALAEYALIARNAQLLRLRGEVETALRYERQCDRIYRLKLPEFARW